MRSKLLDRTPIPQLTIDVTKDIINKSNPQHAGTCAIANALRHEYGASSVRATRESLSFNMLGTDRDHKQKMMRYHYAMPSKAVVPLVKLDDDCERIGVIQARANMKPFSFRLGVNGAHAEPVSTRPHAKPRGKTVKKQLHPADYRRCIRRFHGIAGIKARDGAIV